MKKHLFILLSLLALSSAKAQNQKYQLTPWEYSRVIKKSFTSVVNNNSKTTIGNYASYDIKEGKLAFNASSNFENGNFLSVKASGGVDDNIFNIISGTKVNSNISAEAKFSFLCWGQSGITFNADDAIILHDKIYADSLKLDWERELKINSRTLQMHGIIASIDTAKNQLDRLNKKLLSPAKSSDSLRLTVRLDSLKLALYSITNAPGFEQLGKDNAKSLKRSKEKLLEEFPVTKINYGWFSVAAGFDNNTFKRFDAKFHSLDSQLTKINYTSLRFSGEWNYVLRPAHKKMAHCFLIGIETSRIDNFEDLAKTEIADVVTYADSVQIRSVTKKQNVYIGDYEKNLWVGKAYGDYYLLPLEFPVGVHLFCEATYKDKKVPVNTGAGLMFSFIKQDDKEEKDKLHIEIYYKMLDITNTKESEVSFLGRNEISIRLSLPVSYFNL